MVKHKCDYITKRATVNEPFRVAWSGLPNVFVAGIRYEGCRFCNEVAGIFPAPLDLIKTLAHTIVQKSSSLTGPEIRYLRKSLQKKSSEFAELIGVSPEQVSRWENGHNAPGKSADKLIRLSAAPNVTNRSFTKDSYLLRFRNGSWTL
jgi:DNA-binding transcriptional regulator YiaG